MGGGAHDVLHQFLKKPQRGEITPDQQKNPTSFTP